MTNEPAPLPLTRYFGARRPAPAWSDMEWSATPVGDICCHCSELIEPGDDGVIQPGLLLNVLGEPEQARIVYHGDCWIRTAIGGLNHILGRCTCCGGTEHSDPDPSVISLRLSATAAVMAFEKLHVKH
jgi:hypothetical protein